METNNRLREAVKKLLDVLYGMGIDENTLAIAVESPNCHMKSERALSVLKEVRAALAEPRRNCDVGDEQSQSDRYAQYRASHPPRGIVGQTVPTVDPAIAWGQMPYEGEETT